MAVRSSATAEDTAEASFAGEHDTFLWVRGAEAVAAHVTRCWASLFTPRAVAYRARLGIPDDELAMGVVVQAMVPAEAAGVLLTLDPLNGDRSQVTIEAAYGLGTAVVEGEVTPDRFAVDKVTLELRSRTVGEKAFADRFDPAAGRVVREAVPDALRARPCLDDAEVLELAGLGKRIEQALGVAQDVEWAVGPGPSGERLVWLLQARPETVWSRRPRQAVGPPGTSAMDRMLAYLGRPAAPGRPGPSPTECPAPTPRASCSTWAGSCSPPPGSCWPASRPATAGRPAPSAGGARSTRPPTRRGARSRPAS